MNQETPDNLDELLTRTYEPLARPDAAGRAALLAKLPPVAAAPRGAARRVWPARLGILAAAAAIVLAVAAKSMWLPSSESVYGLETVAQRLREVRTIRVRGTEYLYDSRKPEAAPIRVPVEYLIERPDRYRFSWYSASLSAAPPTIHRGQRICDSRREVSISDSDRKCFIGPISRLDARTRTESLAQTFIVAAMIGTPEAPFKLVARETVGDRRCEIYESCKLDRQWRADGETHVVRLWFDPLVGYPLRLIEERIDGDGRRRREREYDEISVNVPFTDDDFEFVPPEGYEIVERKARSDGQQGLDMTPTAAGNSGSSKLEAWQALQIANDAVLFLWRRSEPEAAADGSRDPLANLHFALSTAKGEHAARYLPVRQLNEPDRWNWSLLVARDGALPARCWIDLALREEGEVRLGVQVLHFDDRELEAILQQACAGWPENETRPSLATLRAQAKTASAAGVRP